MPGYETFPDIRSDVLDRGNELATAGVDFYDTVERLCVRSYDDICNRHPFLFLRPKRPLALSTVAPYRTGTVALTDGSAAITFSAPPAVSVADRKIKLGGFWWRIIEHDAGQAAAVLDAPYTLASNAAAAFEVFQDEYDLVTPDGEPPRHILFVRLSQTGRRIYQRPEDAIDNEYATPAQGWPARYYARIGESRIRFSTYPDRAERLEVPYLEMPPDITADTDGSLIRIPRNFRYVVADHALAFLYAAKSDKRAVAMSNVAEAGIRLLIDDDQRKKVPAEHQPPEPGPYDR